MSAHHHDLPHGAGLIMISVAYHQHMIDAHVCDDRYVDMARLMGNWLASSPEDFIVELERLIDECNMGDLKMSDWGIAPEEFDAMASNALGTNDALFAHDPVQLSHDDVVNILQASWVE